jgi:hypothetical protein
MLLQNYVLSKVTYFRLLNTLPFTIGMLYHKNKVALVVQSVLVNI